MDTGSSIQLANASFTNGLKVSLTCPDRTGLRGEYLLRENATRSIRNIANLAVPAVLIGAGTPVYNPNSVLLSGSASYGSGIAGLDTGLLNTPEYTLIVIRKKMTQGSVGATNVWFGSVTPNLCGLTEVALPGWSLHNRQSGAAPAVAAISTPTDTDFHFFAGSGGNAAKGSVYLATGGAVSSVAGSTAGVAWVPGSETIKLCGIAGNYQMELAYAAVYDRVLTPAQITTAYTTLKAYFASRNLVVS